MLKTICFVLLACVAASAAAQATARPDPADPKATVPARPYEPVFRDYRPYADPEVSGWRRSNEDMGRLGGHLGHAPKAPAPAARPAAKPTAQGGQGSEK